LRNAVRDEPGAARVTRRITMQVGIFTNGEAGAMR